MTTQWFPSKLSLKRKSWSQVTKKTAMTANFRKTHSQGLTPGIGLQVNVNSNKIRVTSTPTPKTTSPGLFCIEWTWRKNSQSFYLDWLWSNRRNRNCRRTNPASITEAQRRMINTWTHCKRSALMKSLRDNKLSSRPKSSPASKSTNVKKRVTHSRNRSTSKETLLNLMIEKQKKKLVVLFNT